jgi:hypothetical protein
MLNCRQSQTLIARIVSMACIAFSFSACRDYDNNKADRATLQRICDPVRDVPAAFEAHRAAHGSYPLSLADLDMSLPKSAKAVSDLNASGEFVYSSGGDAFSLYRKSNWDGGIVFSSMRPEWLYTLNEDKEVSIYGP